MDVLPDDTGGLALGDRVANEAQIVAELRGREPLHELGRLAQLHLEHDGQLAIAAEPGEVQPGDPVQALQRVRDASQSGSSFHDGLVHHALEDGDEQVILGAKVEVHRAGGNTCGPRHVGNLSAEEATLGEGLDRCAQDQVALVGGGRARTGG
jgi:hypothetical protein